MKKTLLIILLLLLGCEEEQTVEIELPIEDYYVVSSEVEAGSEFVDVKISKTVPISSDIGSANTIIDSAVVYILLNNVRVLPLQFNAETESYRNKEDLNIDAGSFLELFINIGGTEIYSFTSIPEEAITASPRLNGNNQIEISINSKKETVYGAIWWAKEADEPLKKAVTFPELFKSELEEVLTVNTGIVNPDILRSPTLDSLYIQVISFDAQYLDYYNTKENNKPIEDVFSDGGGSVRWNVKGKNVIGMFVGTNYGKRIPL